MAITIITTPASADLRGQSHWWGAPDLPADVPYPYVTVGEGTDDVYDEPLTFVCQIRLSDLAALDKADLLPHEGMLYIFAPLDYFLGELDSPLDHYQRPRGHLLARDHGSAALRALLGRHGRECLPSG